MDTNLGLPECCICTDSLEDPRQLPCGHCYCGPHKTCLEILKTGKFFKCAICKSEHHILIADLKPIYGVRDFLKEQQDALQEASKDEPFLLFCHYHPKKQVKFWCTNCELTMCLECTDSETHSDHQFISVSKNFRSIIEQQMKKLSHKTEANSAFYDAKMEQLVLKARGIELEIKNLEAEKATTSENLSKIEAYLDGRDRILDLNCFHWIFGLKEKENTIDCDKVARTSPFNKGSKFKSVNTQTTHKMLVEKSTQSSKVKTTQKQVQTITSPFDLASIQPGTPTQAVRPKLEYVCQCGRLRNSPPNAGCPFPIWHRRLLSEMAQPTQVSVPFAGSQNLVKPVRMDMFRQCDENIRPETDFRYDNHYLSSNDMYVNSIKIHFPYDAAIKHNVKLETAYLINQFCMFQLKVQRQKNNKLRVSIDIRGAEQNTMYTVSFETKSGSDFWIWKNKKLVDSDDCVAVEKASNLDWCSLPVKVRGNSSWTISARVDFMPKF